MSTEIATLPSHEVLSQVLLHGDLSKLLPALKVQYYQSVCSTIGLNPLTQPFAYLKLNGREVLYARKECTDQLREMHNVSVEIVAREDVRGCYVVTARATLPSGRKDESIGAVPIEGLKGDYLANAMMKAETKAKRRVTLSICGLGMLDETEVETIPDAVHVPHPEIAAPRIETAPPKQNGGQHSAPQTDPLPADKDEDRKALSRLMHEAGKTWPHLMAHIQRPSSVGFSQLTQDEIDTLARWLMTQRSKQLAGAAQ